MQCPVSLVLSELKYMLRFITRDTVSTAIEDSKGINYYFLPENYSDLDDIIYYLTRAYLSDKNVYHFDDQGNYLFRIY